MKSKDSKEINDLMWRNLVKQEIKTIFYGATLQSQLLTGKEIYKKSESNRTTQREVEREYKKLYLSEGEEKAINYLKTMIKPSSSSDSDADTVDHSGTPSTSPELGLGTGLLNQ